jgi:hypothetical protein
MELVISAHKSIAELGVIGRAEHMHLIMDAERDATLGYVDRVTRRMGGRRGRGQVVTRTGGLVYAQHPSRDVPGWVILALTIMCWWRTWSRCWMRWAGGKLQIPPCGASICTPRP